MAVCRYGVEKYGSARLLVSSADRGWSGLSAELRSHSAGVIAWKNTQPDTEICVVICGNGSVITRQGGGIVDRTVAERGTIWLSPVGLQEDFIIDISDRVPEILHIYLPSSHFSPDSLGLDLDKSVIASLRYESGFQDPLLAEIAYAIASELQTQSSAGKLLVEKLASSLAARLVQNHVSSPAPVFPRITQEGLDRRRLSRVLDYIEANLEGDLTIDHLASIACLSRFHFARAFKAGIGQAPHQYVSAKRLERAKGLLMRSDQPLVDIALALNFSCQANFTRAFRQVTGQTPGQYRRSFRSK
jgi:AraC family transcriptional regulator